MINLNLQIFWREDYLLQEIKNTICTLIENPEKFDHIVRSRDVSIQTRADLKKVKRVEEILQLNLEVPKSNQIIFKGTLSNSYERGFQLLFYDGK